MDVFEYLLLLLVFLSASSVEERLSSIGPTAGPKLRLSPARRCADPAAGSQRWNRDNGHAACPEQNEGSDVFPAILLGADAAVGGSPGVAGPHFARRTVGVFGER